MRSWTGDQFLCAFRLSPRTWGLAQMAKGRAAGWGVCFSTPLAARLGLGLGSGGARRFKPVDWDSATLRFCR